jgi:ribulose-phosphate 3-epimerase
MNVIPAILAASVDELMKLLRQAESVTDYVQIDVMDGIFAPTKSFPPQEINAIVTPLSFEVHLMVRDPVGLTRSIHNPGLRQVIFHFESEVDHRDFVNVLGSRGLAAGMAVNPETAIAEFGEIVPLISTLLFLTVDPGRYGSPFRPEVLEKVAVARRLFPDTLISVDGGVSLENLEAFYEIGVDSVCIGSRIFLHGDPAENYQAFLRKLNELRTRPTRG